MKNLILLSTILCCNFYGKSQFTFPTGTYFGVGSTPTCLCSADFNNDGNLDFASGNFSSNNISLKFGNGLGGFGTTISLAASTNINGIASADFNNDGKMDLAYINPNLYSVSIRLGNGSGGFGAPISKGTAVGPNAIVCADFNADGNMDLASSNSNTISVLIGNGAGGLATAVNYTAGNQVMAIISGDFNNDGKKDLAAANLNSNSVSIYINAGSGSFATAVNYTVASGPDGLTVADFNNDGKIDIAVSNTDYNNVSVLIGNGLGSFASAAIFNTGSNPIAITSADYNGDGKIDIATANPYADSISVLAGNGLGSFGAAQHFFIAGGPYAILSADYNNDGVKDILTTNYLADNVCLLLNNTSFTITAIAGANGTITPSGASSVAIGGNQAYTINPAPCYHIANLTIDGILSGPMNTYTFTGVNTSHTISATFEPNVITGSSSLSACTSYTWIENGNATYSLSGIYSQTFINFLGCDSVHSLNVNIVACNSILNLKLFLEGYYIGNGQMKPALFNAGVSMNNSLTDSVFIELHATVFPYAVIALSSAILNVNGTSTINFGALTGSFFISIQHMNALGTWSSTPITLSSASPVNYDFTDAASKAFGNNMKEVELGKWAFYSGDINQDENIDLADFSLLELDINNFEFGYKATDINGDGSVDLQDVPLLELNSNLFVFSSHP